MVTFAIISMGEMGAGLASRFVERGAQVVTALEGRSASSIARAKAAGVEMLKDAEILERADIYLSVVPPSAAHDVAAGFVRLVDAGARAPVYIDCNAIAPATLQGIERMFTERGLRFGDGSIIGGPPRPDGYSPRLFLSGPMDDEATSTRAYGIETRLLSARPGDASALKMAYAGIGKGLQALAVAMSLGAERAGVAGPLIEEMAESQPQLYTWLCRMLPKMYAKAYRWDSEMREISAFSDEESGGAEMFDGAAAMFRHVAQANEKGSRSTLIEALDRFAGLPAAQSGRQP